MYIAGDMNVVEHVTLLRQELVCSHASQLIFSSSDVLNDFEQLLWLTSWKWSEPTDDRSYLLFKMVTRKVKDSSPNLVMNPGFQ